MHWTIGRIDSVRSAYAFTYSILTIDSHAEEDSSILGSESEIVQVLAFCTGLLPAAALVVARDTNDLFELGREIISITFRMSIAIQRRLTMIEDSNSSWATTLLGKHPKRVQTILDDFHHVKVSYEIP